MDNNINIIVAFSSKNFGIGHNYKLAWSISEDLQRFKDLTTGSIVVMGRKTWTSLPEKCRPLKNRTNIIVTSKPLINYTTDDGDNVIFMTESELDNYIMLVSERQVFVIGGASLYKKYVGVAKRIYATLVDKDYECDTFFPIENFNNYELDEYSEERFSVQEDCKYRFVTYRLVDAIHGEYTYLRNMQDVIENGNIRTDRTGTGTRSVFGPQLKFNISKNFPLLTTKFVGFKSIIKELLFFLKGHTSSKILEQQGVQIWKPNTTREFLDKRGLTHYVEGDMGPMYGFNWRHFGAEYMGSDANHTDKGYDQLTLLVKGLKEDPFSRRHMITTFNPADVEKSVLAPCHGIITQFYVEAGDDGIKHLSCHTFQRSMDTFLGCPYNIASYAALVHIIAKMCDMLPKELIISTGDCHVYNNHIEQATLQLYRKPLPLCRLEVSETVKDKTFEEISVDDFTLVAYLHHPLIRAPMAV